MDSRNIYARRPNGLNLPILFNLRLPICQEELSETATTINDVIHRCLIHMSALLTVPEVASICNGMEKSVQQTFAYAPGIHYSQQRLNYAGNDTKKSLWMLVMTHREPTNRYVDDCVNGLISLVKRVSHSDICTNLGPYKNRNICTCFLS